MNVRLYSHYCQECKKLTKSRVKLSPCKYCKSSSTEVLNASKPNAPPEKILVREFLKVEGYTEVRIGRNPGDTNPLFASVSINMATVAPVHFYLKTDSDLYICDIVDDFPTYVNGRVVKTSSYIYEGDYISFGGLTYRYCDGAFVLQRTRPGARICIKIRSFEHANSSRKLLAPFDAEVEPGKFVALVGESGCGKSTLLRLIYRKALGIPFSEGQLDGLIDIISNVHQPDPIVSYVPQEPCLLEGLRVEELFNLYASLYETPERAATIRYILSALGLSQVNIRRNLVEKLSGGQRKRVNIGLELLRMPNIILLDEPDSSLDYNNRIKTMHYLNTLRHLGATVVMTTHHSDCLDWFDRYLVVK